MAEHSDVGVLRNFKPERSVREESFVPGIDPGVRDWLVVRQAGRDAQQKGSKLSIVTCDLKYKLNQFWRKQLKSFEAAAEDAPAGQVQLKSDIAEETTTLTQFQAMLSNRCSYEDILTVAMRKRNVSFVDLALKHGISVNFRMGHCRRTMLQTACRDGDIKKCMFLLQAGADVNKRDTQGMTALHLAMQTPSMFHPLEIVTMLLDKGCKINVQDKRGHTPLHLACIVASKDLIEILLHHHALPFILDNKDKLAIDYTKSQTNRLFCEFVATYSTKAHQEKMWSHIVARNVATGIIKVATPSCPICLRTLPECTELKKTKYRYWLFAHHRLNKEVFEDRVKAESRAATAAARAEFGGNGLFDADIF